MKADGIPDFLEPTPNPVTLTPVDAILPSEKDAIECSEGVKEENSGNGRDCTKMVVVDKVSTPTSWRENPYLPTHPTLLRLPEEKAKFLELLKVEKYIIRAAHAYGCSNRTVQRRMVEDADFAVAVDEIIRAREAWLLSKIETVSESEALKEGRNSDRSMQLSALAPGKYKRDTKGLQVATQVNIMIGFTPPKHKGT